MRLYKKSRAKMRSMPLGVRVGHGHSSNEAGAAAAAWPAAAAARPAAAAAQPAAGSAATTGSEAGSHSRVGGSTRGASGGAAEAWAEAEHGAVDGAAHGAAGRAAWAVGEAGSWSRVQRSLQGAAGGAAEAGAEAGQAAALAAQAVASQPAGGRAAEAYSPSPAAATAAQVVTNQPAAGRVAEADNEADCRSQGPAGCRAVGRPNAAAAKLGQSSLVRAERDIEPQLKAKQQQAAAPAAEDVSALLPQAPTSNATQHLIGAKAAVVSKEAAGAEGQGRPLQRTDTAMDLQQGPPHGKSGGAEVASVASPVPLHLLLPMEQQDDPVSLQYSDMRMQITSGSCRPPSSSSIPLLAMAGARPSGVPNLQAAGTQASQGGPKAHAAKAGHLAAPASVGQRPCPGRPPDTGPPVLGGPGSLESPMMASGPDPGGGPAHWLSGHTAAEDLTPVAKWGQGTRMTGTLQRSPFRGTLPWGAATWEVSWVGAPSCAMAGLLRCPCA